MPSPGSPSSMVYRAQRYAPLPQPAHLRALDLLRQYAPVFFVVILFRVSFALCVSFAPCLTEGKTGGRGKTGTDGAAKPRHPQPYVRAPAPLCARQPPPLTPPPASSPRGETRAARASDGPPVTSPPSASFRAVCRALPCLRHSSSPARPRHQPNESLPRPRYQPRRAAAARRGLSPPRRAGPRPGQWRIKQRRRGHLRQRA